MSGNDFPKIGINTQELIDAITGWLEEARAKMKAGEDDFGAVNWGGIGITDIQYRLSMLNKDAKPQCVVIVEEADPSCDLASYLTGKLATDGRFPEAYVECEW